MFLHRIRLALETFDIQCATSSPVAAEFRLAARLLAVELTNQRELLRRMRSRTLIGVPDQAVWA